MDTDKIYMTAEAIGQWTTPNNDTNQLKALDKLFFHCINYL